MGRRGGGIPASAGMTPMYNKNYLFNFELR